MKRKILALTMAAVMALGLCACGGGSTAEEGGAVKLSMATGGTSGTYYGFSGVVAQVLNEKLADTLTINVESTGASAANIDLVDLGSDQLAIVQNDVMYYANTATESFAGVEKNESFLTLGTVYPEVVQFASQE